eukprot:Awhi_evm1s4480
MYVHEYEMEAAAVVCALTIAYVVYAFVFKGRKAVVADQEISSESKEPIYDKLNEEEIKGEEKVYAEAKEILPEPEKTEEFEESACETKELINKQQQQEEQQEEEQQQQEEEQEQQEQQEQQEEEQEQSQKVEEAPKVDFEEKPKSALKRVTTKQQVAAAPEAVKEKLAELEKVLANI